MFYFFVIYFNTKQCGWYWNY